MHVFWRAGWWSQSKNCLVFPQRFLRHSILMLHVYIFFFGQMRPEVVSQGTVMTGNSKQWANYYSLSFSVCLSLSLSPPPPSHRSSLPSVFPWLPPSLALSPSPTVEIQHWYASEITMETSSLLSSMSGLQRAEHFQPLQTTRVRACPKMSCFDHLVLWTWWSKIHNGY